MRGTALLLVFMLLGFITARRLFSMFGVRIRAWMGFVMGLMELMWLPSLYAFIFDFTLTANIWALATAAAIAIAAQFIPKKRCDNDAAPLKLVLCLMVPIMILSIYLQYTHTLMPKDGALYVGQSTYGDLCLHLGIATGLRGAEFPPEYTILPGTMLGYPFLFDALSASMMLFGTSLAGSFIIPGAIGMGLVCWGFIELSWEMTKNRLAVVIAFLLAFLNGGLGFMYVLDGLPGDWSKLYDCLFGFYRAPANIPEYNLRWSNVVCDLMLPQRTLLAGWMTVLPAFYMLVKAVKSNGRRLFAILGVWAGLMPMIHTHSFLALGLVSAGCMLSCVLFEREWRSYTVNFIIYAAVAVLLASGQLFTWTFPQSLGSDSIRFWFNWVNNDEYTGLIDGYFWFWIKNVGPAYILMLPAAFNAPKRLKHLCAGCLTVYIAAELIRFQPNSYDNNKLFYLAFFLMLPLVGKLLADIWRRLRGVRLRSLLAAVFLAVCLTSGALSLAREAISSYRLFSKSEAQAADFISANIPIDSVILTGVQHDNAVAALTGRKIVCGTPSYLYYHGVDYLDREMDVGDMYQHPLESGELFEKYNVKYIYLSFHEQSAYDVDYEALYSLASVVYRNDFVEILSVEGENTSPSDD